MRRLGALVAAGWLARRLPGPLRALSGLLTSHLKGERGFGFWWVVVTLAIALAIGAVLALLVSPVAALIALLVVGIWMLFQRARKKDDEEDDADHVAESGRSHGNGAREPRLASAS